MPAQPRVDPGLVAALADHVARARDEAFDASGQLLEQVVEAGDAATQQAVDTLVEQAADTLRALTDAFTDTARQLRLAAARYAETDAAVGRAVAAPPEGA